MKTMKESAAGRAEVTISMIKHLPEVGSPAFHHLIKRMWGDPADTRLRTPQCALVGSGDAVQTRRQLGSDKLCGNQLVMHVFRA